MKYKSYISTRE